MTNNSGREWEHEFREFIDSAEIPAPAQLSDKIRTTIHAALNPSAFQVFLKLLVISTMAGLLSLAICPQFGFGGNLSLMRYFMKLGPHICSMACGAFFIGVGVILSSLFMRPEELRVLRRTEHLQFSALSMLALSAFICTSGAVMSILTIFWLGGAFVGALLSFELSYRFRIAPA
ncbi:MAG: hypothetical protein K1X83_14650 [Oligoflexia bacterium]|nr:hypothetical protein [Oligoflexia bacterium]